VGGFDGLEDAIERGKAAGLSTVSVAYVNLGSCRLWASGPEAALAAYDQARDHASRRGTWSRYRWAQAESLWALYDLGRWDELLTIADEVLAASPLVQVTAMVQPMRARVLVQRGDLNGAAEAIAGVLSLVREIGIAQVVGPALPAAAAVAVARGEREGARALLREFAERGEASPGLLVWHFGDAVRAAAAIGEGVLAEKLVAIIDPVLARDANAVLGARAILAEAAGETARAAELYCEAAERWGTYGSVIERAYTLAGLGRCAADNDASAEARRIFSSLGTPGAPLSDAATG
jgi:tetratricopeptide (TPR) repeat protein